MKPKLLLRISAVIMFLHLLGHMRGASTWKDNPDAAVQTVVKGMEENHFMFMGASQTLAGHHEGYGYASALALLFFTVVLWVVSDVSAQTKAMSSKLILAISIILFLYGIDEMIYFFPFAASFSFISSLLGLIAWIQLRKVE